MSDYLKRVDPEDLLSKTFNPDKDDYDYDSLNAAAVADVINTLVDEVNRLRDLVQPDVS